VKRLKRTNLIKNIFAYADFLGENRVVGDTTQSCFAVTLKFQSIA